MAKLRQLEPIKVTIGEYNFYVKPFPAMVTANLTGELASMLTPIFAALIPLIGDDGGESNRGLLDIDVNKAAISMASCMDGFSGNKVENLIKKLLITYKNIAVELPEYNEYEGETGDVSQEILTLDIVNEIFCGEVQDMFILAFHVIKLNFNGFFRKLGDRYGKVAEALTKKTRKIL